MSDIARLLEECGCDCVEHRDLEDHDCLAGKAEFEWVEMKKEIERLRARIEELKEQSSYWENVAFNLALGREETSDFLSGHHIITTDKIRAAWREMLIQEHRLPVLDVFFGEGMRKALGMLGIVRCEKASMDWHDKGKMKCVDCNGEGFVIGGGDE